MQTSWPKNSSHVVPQTGCEAFQKSICTWRAVGEATQRRQGNRPGGLIEKTRRHARARTRANRSTVSVIEQTSWRWRRGWRTFSLRIADNRALSIWDFLLEPSFLHRNEDKFSYDIPPRLFWYLLNDKTVLRFFFFLLKSLNKMFHFSCYEGIAAVGRQHSMFRL